MIDYHGKPRCDAEILAFPYSHACRAPAIWSRESRFNVMHFCARHAQHAKAPTREQFIPKPGTKAQRIT